MNIIVYANVPVPKEQANETSNVTNQVPSIICLCMMDLHVRTIKKI